MIAEKPDIIAVVQAEGIELRRRGHRLWGLCPFHAERMPSFMVDEQRQAWRCFGACSAGGDAIEFIMRLHRLDFKGALRHLGIGDGPAPSRAERRQREERAELAREFRGWCITYHGRLCAWYRAAQFRKASLTPEAAIRMVSDYHLTSRVMAELDILEGDDDGRKIELYAEVQGRGATV